MVVTGFKLSFLGQTLISKKFKGKYLIKEVYDEVFRHYDSKFTKIYYICLINNLNLLSLLNEKYLTLKILPKRVLNFRTLKKVFFTL